MRDQTIYITPDSAIKSITIDNGGTGYINPPTVTFSSVDAGQGAAGTAIISGGIVTGVHITNPGQGYETAPLVSFSAPPDPLDTTALGTAVLSGGIKYNLENKNIKSLLTEEGFGMAPIEFITQRGPFQHGESLRDYFLRPRVMQLFIRRNGCTRDQYWTNRLQLLDLLRPNRVLSNCDIHGTLRRITSDGQKFDIKVVAVEGPGFAQVSDRWDEFSYQESIRFVAHDPTFFSPTLITSYLYTGEYSVVFGDTEPLANSLFGTDDALIFGMANSITNIVNQGTWKTYPTIKIYGPQTSFAIWNNTTGKHIGLSYNIAAGTYVQIGLEYGRKYVQLNNGTNLIGYVSGDLATFALEVGTNEIEIQGTEESVIVDLSTPSLNTPRVEVSYYTRYIGI